MCLKIIPCDKFVTIFNVKKPYRVVRLFCLYKLLLDYFKSATIRPVTVVSLGPAVAPSEPI